MTTIHWLAAATIVQLRRPGSRLRGDLGEGVISVAIAVLIMAFLGAAMWVGFQKMWKNTENSTNTKVQQIGSE